MKQNVYLVQANAVYGESVKSAYLPYASGCLAAYAWADDRIRERYRLGRFIFTKENIDEAVASLEFPFLVGFSCYVWNMEYNKRFAAKLKERYPETVVVFGGHNVRPDGSDLNDLPYVDLVMHGEGEQPFKRLLLALAEGTDPAEVDNLSFRDGDRIVTTKYTVPCDISDYPSPYTGGYFDDIIRDSGILPSVIWETNRGCPNRCAFCDWGALKARVRQFPMERIEAELRWFVENKVEYVYCADANFGLFPRDSEIADKMIDLKHRYGYPKMFKTNYTKNKDDVVFEISSKLIRNGMGKSPTLSFQSLSPEVLKNIGRSNMELQHFRNLMARYSEAGIPVYSELILALPGETYDSFADGVCTLLDCNQHTCIGIYPCELLPNSQLGSREYREKFEIETVQTGFTEYHVRPQEGASREKSNIIVSTSTMKRPDWKRAFLFSVCVQALHNLALTRAFAVYLRQEARVPYKRFYEELIAWMASRPDTVAGGAYRVVEEHTDGFLRGTASSAIAFGEKEELTWTFEEFMFLYIVREKERFYRELRPFLEGFGLTGELLEELTRYQSGVLKTPGETRLSLTSAYDFYNYFRRIYTDRFAPLERRENTLTAETEPLESFDLWARVCVWYGRRDDAQLYTGKKNTVTQRFGA